MMPMRKMLDRMEGDPGQLAAMLSPRDQHVAGSAGKEEEGQISGAGEYGLSGGYAERLHPSTEEHAA